MSVLSSAEEEAIIEAVRRVSQTEILPRFRALDASEIGEKSGIEDLVTVADRASEAAIAEALAEILPTARIVGEEAVAADRSLLNTLGLPGYSVIVDPIDGTWNYANGLGVFGVIVAVLADGETVFGLLYDPLGDDWILTRRGGGTEFVRPGQPPVPLRVGAETGHRSASGYVGAYLYPEQERVPLMASLAAFRRTMSLRCSCHEYRMQAQGRADFALGGMLNPWDHAAGVLALTEAGGVARLLDGTPYRPTMTKGRLLTACTEALWDDLATLWQDFA